MKFAQLSEYLEKLEKTSSRLEITRILADLFQKTSIDEIDKVTYLTLGKLAPKYSEIVFNLAEKLMLEVLSKSYGVEKEKVLKSYKKLGDLGNTAYELASNPVQKIKDLNLSVNSVFDILMDIAKDEGEKSVERKVGKMAKLLSQVDPHSAKFLSRIPVGKLRLGFSDKTIIDALSWMETGDKSKSKLIENAYVILPDVGLLSKNVKQKGIDATVKNINPIVGVPVLPMLAQRIKSPKEMIEKMGDVYVEPKFDGLRVLIHFNRKSKDLKVGAFTRNLNNVIGMFPELKNIGNYLNADSVILDTEAVGLSPDEKKMADFQTTMKRRRIHNIEEIAKNIPLRFQVFDIILLDGVSLMNEPYEKRREVLAKTIKKNNLLVVDSFIETKDSKVINEEYVKKIKEGLEGIIVKKKNATYVPGRTGWRWVKMKMGEKSAAKLADTVDCVVMGFTAGKGKRAGFGIGQFLVGVRADESILSTTKVGTGLSDDLFRELAIRLRKLQVKDKPKEYGDVDRTLLPDYWVSPNLVVEIAADEITKSPIHSSGFALRFPRLIKIRDDKSVDESTTVGELEKLFKLQKN